MDSEVIRELLKRYWDCETSLEEEKILRDFFQQEAIPEDLKKYREMFLYFKREQQQSLSEDFDKKILDGLHSQPAQGKQRYLSSFYKVAAAVILILSFVVIHQQFIVVKDTTREIVKDTFEDPERALEETKRVLCLVSEKLNKG